MPTGVALNSKGHVFIVNKGKMKLMKFDSDGNFVRFLAEDVLVAPHGLRIDENDNIWVTDIETHMVFKINPKGIISLVLGQKGTSGLLDENGNFNNPHNVVIDNNGLLYVADRHNNRIQIFTANGDFIKSWTHLGTPWGLAINDNQKIFMTDGTNEKILRLNIEGEILSEYNQGAGQDVGQMRTAHGIAIDKHNSIYVAEVLNWRVQKFSH